MGGDLPEGMLGRGAELAADVASCGDSPDIMVQEVDLGWLGVGCGC
jgi:hypothetical protein